MAVRRRLFVSRFFYEGNSFGPVAADQAAFERHEWVRGEAAIARSALLSHELAVLQPFEQAYPDWELIASRCGSAVPAGPIVDAVFEGYMRELLADLETANNSGGVDAIYLSLHGAAITESRQHPDLDLVEEVRLRCPEVPLAATFDMHGNLHPRLATLLTLGRSYRTHPHVDMRAVAERTLAQLVRCVEEGLTTHCEVVQTGLLLPSINMRTSDGPMRDLQSAAASAETRVGVLAASVLGGFPYMDAPHTGASVLVCTTAVHDPDGSLALEVAHELADRLRQEAPRFRVQLPRPSEAITRTLANIQPGLVAIADAADNPYSGGAADTPGLLRAVVDALAIGSCLIAAFADADVVQRANQVGIGVAFDVQLGAKRSREFGEPVPLRVVPLRFSDGRYVRTSPVWQGMQVDAGQTVLLALAERPDVRVIVTSAIDAADDRAFYELHGVKLENERLLLVRGKSHFRAGAGALCAQIIDVDAPGPACLDLGLLPYRRLNVAEAVRQPE
ncbi:MAG: M81 family metallopeptidase [Gammaproteobacteria bacterium]